MAIRPLLCLCCAVAAMAVQAAELGMYVRQDGGIGLRIPEAGGQWLLLERSVDPASPESWRIFRDSAAGPHLLPLPEPLSSQAFFRARPVPAPQGPFTVAVIGDSTAAGDFPDQVPPRVFGWAYSLPGFAEEAGTTIHLTTAEPAISTKTFFTSPLRHERVLGLIRPQMTLVQLGQIDEFTPLVALKATTLEEYRTNLGRIVDLLRGLDCAPVLVTLLPFREGGSWNNGDPVTQDEIARQLARTLVVREVARDKGVWLVDLYQMLGDLFRSLPPEERDALGAFDAHHLSRPGADLVADMAIDALPPHFRELFFVRPPVQASP